VLLLPSCFGLRYLISVCLQFGSHWDIKFNPLKSQLMTFDGDNPIIDINMNGLPIPWASKVKYLGVCFLCNSGKTDLTDTIRRFYSQFNNIMSVLGKGCHEMNAVHLIKTYCLPTLTYGLENSVLNERTKDKISVLWNNCFRHIFRCCWRESVRHLQYYCRTLPMLHLVNQTKVLFWKKMYTNSNVLLYTLSRYACLSSRFMAVASQYGIHSLRQTVGSVKFDVWKFFTETVHI